MTLGYWKDGEFISFQATWIVADELALEETAQTATNREGDIDGS